MRFEFATATRIMFGAGVLAETGRAMRDLFRRALVVTGRNTRRADPLLKVLGAAEIQYVHFSIAGEPTTDEVMVGVARAREKGCDGVIGFGGGSAMDAAKAIAALLANEGELHDYLEVIGHGLPLKHPSVPCAAIPTTAGTGAEVTRNAVLASPEHRVKASLRSPFMLPRLAVVDAELTLPMPREITAQTGLDALTQLIEPYVCNHANPLTDALCLDGIRRVARSLAIACSDPVDLDARTDMSLASLYGGLALANAGLGAVHGFAAPIGGMFPAPHGGVCAALLPQVMAMNLRVLESRHPGHDALRRYQDVARALTDRPDCTAEDGVIWTRELCRALEIPGLSAYDVTEADADAIVEKALKASSMKANPVPLTATELREVLVASLA